MLKKWEDLPHNMQNPKVRVYYDKLYKKRHSLILKRIFDLICALILLVILSPVFIVLSIMIALDSPGGVFFRQTRVTTYGKEFKIHKFRTMVSGADKKGTQVTVSGDNRITRVGKLLRSVRLDELPQLFDVISGNMSFVGTRPEVPKYVEAYSDEMLATLLMPAGITSEASIRFKGESKMLADVDDVDKVYIEKIMPKKMVYNLRSVARFSFAREILTMIRTVFAVLGRDFYDYADIVKAREEKKEETAVNQ